VLPNPFDLTFAADLLAQGSKPSAIALIDEAFLSIMEFGGERRSTAREPDFARRHRFDLLPKKERTLNDAEAIAKNGRRLQLGSNKHEDRPDFARRNRCSHFVAFASVRKCSGAIEPPNFSQMPGWDTANSAVRFLSAVGPNFSNFSGFSRDAYDFEIFLRSTTSNGCSAWAQIRIDTAGSVFALLLFLYERFSVAISILIMPLLATCAVFVGLWLTGIELAIFFFSEFDDLLATGMPSLDSLIAAGRNRTRPIAMTTIAAILTLLPLALATGQGSAMQQPLAIAIISGLVVQLPLVLLVMPALYILMSRPAHASVNTAPENHLR
jgi:hypothetical protein